MQEIGAPLGLPLRRMRASASFDARSKVAQRFAGDGPTSPLGDAFLGGVKGGAKSGDVVFLIGGKAYFHGESLTP